MATETLLPRNPQCGQWGYITPAFSRLPKAQHADRIRAGYGERLIFGAYGWTRWLHLPYHLGGPQENHLHLRNQCNPRGVCWQRPYKTMLTLCRLYPAQGGKEKWLPRPRYREGPTRRKRGCISPPFSSVANPKHGDEIIVPCLKPTLVGAHLWTKCLHHRCHVGDSLCSPRGRMRKQLPNTCQFKGPLVGKVAEPPQASRG